MTNAPNPSSTDDGVEALQRAQRAHESSMEEILASLRSIIAEGDSLDSAKTGQQKSGAAAGPQIVYVNESPPSARALVPGIPSGASGRLADVVSLASRAPQESAAFVAEAPVSLENELGPERPAQEPVASPATDRAVGASFGALSASVAMQNPEAIENLMREMLRPMLKIWLDDNLPRLAERMVRAEIQRIARGGR